MLIPSPPPHEIHSSACSYLLMMTQKLRKERCHTAGNPKRWLNSAYLRKRVEHTTDQTAENGRKSLSWELRCDVYHSPVPAAAQRSTALRAQNLKPGVASKGSNRPRAVQPVHPVQRAARVWWWSLPTPTPSQLRQAVDGSKSKQVLTDAFPVIIKSESGNSNCTSDEGHRLMSGQFPNYQKESSTCEVGQSSHDLEVKDWASASPGPWKCVSHSYTSSSLPVTVIWGTESSLHF